MEDYNVRYYAHMIDGWKVEIGENLYKRIRAGLTKYPGGGGVLTNPQVVANGSIIVGRHIVGIERKSEGQLRDESEQTDSSLPDIMSYAEFVEAFESSQLTQAAFAERVGMSVTWVANLLKQKNPLTAQTSQAVRKAFPGDD